MKQYVLDTDILIYFLKGREHVVRRVARQAPEALHTTIVNHAELLYGAYNSVKKSQNLAKVEAFLNRIAILPFCEDASRQFAEHKAALRKKGQGVADMDLMIASISQQRGMVLVVLCQKGLPFGLKKTKNGTWNGFWERSTGLAERSTEYHTYFIMRPVVSQKRHFATKVGSCPEFVKQDSPV